MTVAIVFSRALAGVHAPLVTVEVHLAGGLPAFHLVGLPETEVKESRDRVRAAIQNAKFEFPQWRITVNLAPAELPKDSGRFDLPIAIGVLVASGQLNGKALPEFEFAGELRIGRSEPVSASATGGKLLDVIESTTRRRARAAAEVRIVGQVFRLMVASSATRA